jgi:hypothetical protein
VRVQSLSSTAEVKAGTTARFVIWVWSVTAESYGTSIRASVGSSKDAGPPSFEICPVPDGTACKVGNLPTAQVDELEAAVRVGAKAPLGELVKLTAKASAKGSRSYTRSASDVVVVTPTVNPSLPTVTPPNSLPTLPSGGTSPSNPAGLFPTVPPSSPSTGLPGLPRVSHHQAPAHVATVSATVPLDARLIGGQLAGLAVLAGAVAIAVVRLSLRRPRGQEGNAPPSPPQ